MTKVSKTDKIMAGNLIEEVSEAFENCIKCGMCKSRCGVFRVLKEEHYSARGKGELLGQKTLDKILFECNLCKACEKQCPLNIKVCEAVLKGREAMVLLGRGLKENTEMVKSVKKHGKI